MAEKTTEEAQGSLNAEGQAQGQAQAGGGIGANASSKKTQEKRTPKKLGQKKKQEEPHQQPTPPADDADSAPEDAEGGAEQDVDMNGNADAEVSDNEPQQELEKQQPRGVSNRRRSRARGRRGNPVDSETESIARSDVSATGGRRNRQRQRQKGGQQQQQQGLGGISEGLPGGELVGQAGDLVQNTAGNAVNQVGDTAGKALGGLTGGGKGDDDGGEKAQLRLRLELNLDIEVQLKAKIHGDLTLGLLYVARPPFRRRIANPFSGTKHRKNTKQRVWFKDIGFSFDNVVTRFTMVGHPPRRIGASLNICVDMLKSIENVQLAYCQSSHRAPNTACPIPIPWPRTVFQCRDPNSRSQKDPVRKRVYHYLALHSLPNFTCAPTTTRPIL